MYRRPNSPQIFINFYSIYVDVNPFNENLCSNTSWNYSRYYVLPRSAIRSMELNETIFIFDYFFSVDSAGYSTQRGYIPFHGNSEKQNTHTVHIVHACHVFSRKGAICLQNDLNQERLGLSFL